MTDEERDAFLRLQLCDEVLEFVPGLYHQDATPPGELGNHRHAPRYLQDS